MSISPPSAPRRLLTLTTLNSAAVYWARTAGRTWIYLFKVLAAVFLALFVAMKLDLPQPRTAMLTVFIVMQPQSGMVFAKSFYRICGTLAGLVAMLVFISLFSQQPELFIASTAIWVGICTAGAARNRNFRTYGFVLAGYTAALVGFHGAQHPDDAFVSALTRVAEVVIGIVCAGAVSGLVFPQLTGEQMRTTARARFSAFVDYIAASLSGRLVRTEIEATNARFVADVVGFEAIRSVAVFETPASRMRSGRLSRLNSEFMAASTRFHALHQLMNRLRDAGASAAIEAIEPYFKEIAPLLDKSGEPVLTAADAAHAARQLEAYKPELRKRMLATRDVLEAKPDVPLLDFDTAAELLFRFIDDLHAYTATYASLAVDAHERERWIEHYEPKTNAFVAGVAGIRATIVLALLGAFWIATAWPSGGETLLPFGAAVSALASSSPNPTRAAFQMAGGAILTSLMAMIVIFGLYPRIDGFPLLCVALAPFLLLGVFMTTRPKLAGYGVGYCISFCFLAGPDNVISYDPAGVMNDALATFLGMAVAAVAFALLLPPSLPWMRNRLLVDLRRQIVPACHSRLKRLRSRFESGTRDLMFQINALAAKEPEVQRDSLRWLFTVLEVGNAIIDMRLEIGALPDDARYEVKTSWRVAERKTRDAVAALFDRPDTQRLYEALAATTDALAAIQQAMTTFTSPDEERHQLQRILSHLHFIRTALLDPQSPLGARVDAPTNVQDGVRHAT
ncbi:FUSC family protein [Paraburkholderia sp. GAS32]|uniref:FUSC family protein n=1 Tax=Paraburkholderia sp. GAS32 TaxID=3035129 RepID=UPI003D2457EA